MKRTLANTKSAIALIYVALYAVDQERTESAPHLRRIITAANFLLDEAEYPIYIDTPLIEGPFTFDEDSEPLRKDGSSVFPDWSFLDFVFHGQDHAIAPIENFVTEVLRQSHSSTFNRMNLLGLVFSCLGELYADLYNDENFEKSIARELLEINPSISINEALEWAEAISQAQEFSMMYIKNKAAYNNYMELTEGMREALYEKIWKP